MVVTKYEEIVNNFDSPNLVLAGPGSGKTYLLADRIKILLNNNIPKENIMVITFGIDARRNMKHKLIDKTGDFRIPSKDLPHISTMNSLGFEIVRHKPHDVGLLKTNLRVQYEDEVKKLMYRDAALNLGYSETEGISAIDCKQFGDCKEDETKKECKICKKYREIMSICNCIDYDDQIIFACRILENNENIISNYQSKAQHLLVDEYQDINAAQFKLIDLLSKKNRKGLFAVGDDAQSIYGFRGGSPQFILSFKDYFPDATIGNLAHSWRCPENIMNDSFRILEKYYQDWSGKPKLKYHVDNSDKPYIWNLRSELAEAEMVAKATRYFIPNDTVLILAPKKEFFPLISKALVKYNVPHECPIDFLPPRIEVLKRFLDLTQNPSDNFLTRLVIEHLINTGIAKVPGANKKKIKSEETLKNRIDIEIEISKLWDFINKKNSLTDEIFNYSGSNKIILKIKESLNVLFESSKNFKKNKGDFIKNLVLISKLWIDPSQLADDINSIVEALSPKRPAGAGSVELKTLRKAKGLEADIVFIVGLEDDLLPSSLGNNIVEKARLLYVSMTRAKKKLYMFHSYKRPRNISYGEDILDKKRSRFLDSIGRQSKFMK